MCGEENRIAEYLRKRPIAPILEQSDGKDDLIVLKIVYILDFEMERNQLYDRIQNANSDRLLMQLMQFYTFQSLKYYDYNVKREIKKFVLRCTECGLLGPFACILSHMAINHNLHIGLKMCLYCDRAELQKHIDNDSLERCYRNYLREQNICEWDTSVSKIVSEFYDMLRKIFEKFSTITVRNPNYAAKRTSRRLNSGNMNINLSALDDEFNRIQVALSVHGNDWTESTNATRRSRRVSETKYSLGIHNEIGNMSDDDDDVEIVDIVKNEPSIDIPAPQNEPSSSGSYYPRRSRDSAITESVSTAQLLTPTNQFERSDAERFGLFVAQSLAKLPTDIQRRQLEIEIETAILNAKKAAFQ